MSASSVTDAWEHMHQAQAWGQYPPENLIRWIAKNYPHIQERASVRVLDLGCGGGACTWFLAEAGFQVYGIDASQTAIETARTRLTNKHLSAQLSLGCMSALPYEEQTFDLIIDMCSMGILQAEQIRRTLMELHRVLKPEGQYFGFFMGDKTSIMGEIDPQDPSFYTHITAGPLRRSATARLFTPEALMSFFNAFQWVSLEATTRTENNQTELVHRWWLTVKK